MALTVHFKEACGHQLPLGPGRAASVGHVCPMCLGTETRVRARACVCVFASFVWGPHGSKCLQKGACVHVYQLCL